MANTGLLRCGDNYTVALKTWDSVLVMLMTLFNPLHLLPLFIIPSNQHFRINTCNNLVISLTEYQEPDREEEN